MLPNLTLFDLDHTLIPVDSDYEWGEFLIAQGLVDGLHYRTRNDEFYAQYRAGTLDIKQFLGFSLAPLAAHDYPALLALQAQFMREIVLPQIRGKALELVRSHTHAGDLCAVVTATNAFVAAPIALAFGVQNLIASVPAQENGQFSGAVRGIACYRQGKVARIEAWLESLGCNWAAFSKSTFYSDSHNDIALLERVSEPVATNAEPMLRAHATRCGWRILDLFDDQ